MYETKYCVVKNDVIWGIGTSPKAAFNEAKGYLFQEEINEDVFENSDELMRYLKEIKIYPCTEEVYSTVIKRGGNIPFIIGPWGVIIIEEEIKGVSE